MTSSAGQAAGALAAIQTVLATALDAVVVMRSDGTVADWNRHAEDIFGWNREEALGRSMGELIVPEQHRDAHARGLVKFLATGQGPVIGRRLEVTALRRDGTEFPVELAITPFGDEGEKLFLGFLRDISQRTAADEMLRESERNMAAVLESISDGFCSLDRDWRVLLFNRAAERFFGLSRAQVIGRNFWELFPAAKGSLFEEQYRRVLDEQETIEFVTHSMTMEGRLVAVRAAPTPDGGIAIAFTDVTEWQRTERELAERGAYLAALFEQTTAALAQTNDQGRFIVVNDRFCQIAGRTREELLTLRMQDITHPDDLPGNVVLFRRAVETGEPFEIEKRYIRPDGSHVWVSNSVAPIRVHKERPITILSVGVDITERKIAEEHQKLLINELNHRVKNSLAVVQAIAQQSFRDPAVPAEAKAAFEGRLAALSAAHNVLTAQNWESASIHQMVEDAIAPYGASRFIVDGPPLRLSPRTAVSLALALHELGTNAAKYGALSTPEGKVEILWSVENDELSLGWHERDGPRVTAPSRRGFGTRLIERSLAAEFGGTIDLSFPPEGVVCLIRAPLPALH